MMMMMMMSQRWSFWSIGFGVLPPKSLPFPSIDDDDDDDDDVAVFAAASRRMRVVHCYRSATAVSMMRAYVLGVKRERKRPHIEAKCFPKSSSFPLETAKVSAREKKKTTIKKKKTKKKKKIKKKRLLLCAAGSDDGVHHPDIVNFFFTSSLRSL